MRIITAARNGLRSLKQDCSGLSLIETAIGLVILGLLVLPILQSYRHNLIERGFKITSGALEETTNAIDIYYYDGNDSYPCPTNLRLRQGDLNFGQSGDCTLANIRLCTDPTWFANEGICKTEDTVDAVIIGGAPFSTLQLQQEEILDFWGNKLLYAVSLNKTNSATFANPATITVFTVDNPQQVIAGSADGIPDALTDPYSFVLTSTGASGVGGYTKDGVLISLCGTAATGYDNENCDFDDTFFFTKHPTDEAANAFAEVTGPTFFDDFSDGREGAPPQGTWYEHDNNAAFVDRDYAATSAMRVGIGTSTPTYTLDVEGDIRVENSVAGSGWLQADAICNANDSDCFDPELITGTEDAMECDAEGDFYGNQGVMEISDRSVKCSSAIDNTGNPIDNEIELRVNTGVITPQDCSATGMLAAGINSSGDIICVAP